VARAWHTKNVRVTAKAVRESHVPGPSWSPGWNARCSPTGHVRPLPDEAMMSALWSIIAVLAFASLDRCDATATGGARASSDTQRRVLPAPQRSGGAALATVLATRRSARSFGTRDLDEHELGQLLWAAQGTTDGHRTAPSAGALYPLAVRVADRRGVWRYVPADHALVREIAGDRRGEVVAASYGQESIRGAPVVLAITAETAITARKYGARAERYATLEAGHAAQNILLTATALGLRSVPVGAFDDDAVRRALALSSSETPLYLIPVGAAP
jgi:SagB-type dehydrogenase family enzyme